MFGGPWPRPPPVSATAHHNPPPRIFTQFGSHIALPECEEFRAIWPRKGVRGQGQIWKAENIVNTCEL